ncbi:RGD1559578 [Phodopus roborovskii]|uniref:RGD1559578 protein n=1 Tax=Phodopus roborovskii TaxID=109678 RepID=A0AAU9YM08_PHORO|nr:RGD1559578 [Phodopus roborovskii]
MSHFNNWKSTQMSPSSISQDNIRVPHERKKENKKHEDFPEGHHSPHGQTLQDTEAVWSAGTKTKESGEDAAAEEGPSFSKIELRKDMKEWRLPTPLGPVNSPLISSGLSDSKATGLSCELSPPTAKSFRIYDVSPLSSPNLLQKEKMCPHRRTRMARLPQQGPFRHLMDMKAEKRLAGWKERRSRFGDISTHKCYQFGQIFSPFQALATTEMRRLVLPRDLPVSSRMQRISTSSLSDMTLQDLPLSPSELGLGKDDNHHEKEKSVSHIKTPLFPPIVKATKYNDMK